MNNGRKEADIKAAKQFIVDRKKDKEKRKEKKAGERMKNNFPGINRLKELGSKMRGDGITKERLTMMPFGTRDTLLGQARSGNSNLATALHNKGMFKEKDAILSGDIVTLISMNNHKFGGSHAQHIQLNGKDTETNDNEDIRTEHTEKRISAGESGSRSGRVSKPSRKLYSSTQTHSSVPKSLSEDYQSVPAGPAVPAGPVVPERHRARTKPGVCPVALSHVEKALLAKKSRKPSTSIKRTNLKDPPVSGAFVGRQQSYTKEPLQLFKDPKETNIDIQKSPLNLTNSKENTSQEMPLDFSKSSIEYKPTGDNVWDLRTKKQQSSSSIDHANKPDASSSVDHANKNDASSSVDPDNKHQSSSYGEYNYKQGSCIENITKGKALLSDIKKRYLFCEDNMKEGVTKSSNNKEGVTESSYNKEGVTESSNDIAANAVSKKPNYKSIFDLSFEKIDYEKETNHIDNDKDLKSKDKHYEHRKEKQTTNDSKRKVDKFSKTTHKGLDDLNSTLKNCQISKKGESIRKTSSRRQPRVPPPERYVNLPGNKKIQNRVKVSTFKDRNFLDFMKHRPSSSKKLTSSKFEPLLNKKNHKENKASPKLDTALMKDKISNQYSSLKRDICSRSSSAQISEKRNIYLNMMELNADTKSQGYRRREKIKSGNENLLTLHQKNKETRELKFITSTPRRNCQDENTLPQGCQYENTSKQGSMDFEQAFLDFGKEKSDSKICRYRKADCFQESNEIVGIQYQDQYKEAKDQYQPQFISYPSQQQYVPLSQQYNLQNVPLLNQQVLSKNQLNGSLLHTSQDVITQIPIVQPQMQSEHQMQSVQPQMQAVQPQMQSVQPQMQSAQHQMQAVQPQMQAVQPQMQAVPEMEAVQPQMQAVQPQMQAVPQMEAAHSQMEAVQPQMQSAQHQMQAVQPQMQAIQPQIQAVQSQIPKSYYPTQPFLGQSQTPQYQIFPSTQTAQNQFALQFNGFSFPQNKQAFQHSLTAQNLQDMTAQTLLHTASRLQNPAAQIQSQVAAKTQYQTAAGLQKYHHTSAKQLNQFAGQGQDENTGQQQQYQTSVQPQYYSASQYQTSTEHNQEAPLSNQQTCSQQAAQLEYGELEAAAQLGYGQLEHEQLQADTQLGNEQLQNATQLGHGIGQLQAFPHLGHRQLQTAAQLVQGQLSQYLENKAALKLLYAAYNLENINVSIQQSENKTQQ